MKTEKELAMPEAYARLGGRAEFEILVDLSEDVLASTHEQRRRGGHNTITEGREFMKKLNIQWPDHS